MDSRPKLRLLLASPRGFCAGVDRAIQIVVKALEKFGAPVYVRHEIVHNRFVVRELEKRGAVFVDELDQVPQDACVVFSAHGVPKSVYAEADRRHLEYIDATCPLVSKVHGEASRRREAGYEIVLIGHAGHPEVAGIMGQLPEGAIILVENIKDVDAITPRTPERLAYITQTTLSLDDTAEIVAALQKRFPEIKGPHREDICYATANRQMAVKNIAGKVDIMLVVGAHNSSNSLRLVEVAKQSGCERAQLINHVGDIDWDEFAAPECVGLTAGASAPEKLLQEIIAEMQGRFQLVIEEIAATEERVSFKLPAALQE
ncbi:MAG: 4-hydroxy-3-methylbut-2-enyl diphosphate reductase [Hyphomicrobiales bacterium]|nr:4-hydroxy-3-methylbut-2-enyl diphosphate reductase [Hyphomicrobiales bacterium]MCY4033306.1 4-hydroxy-3-methylbut-2-enyl diphosphate reductase [Hyphomicrobiales bacterium]MCY4039503.1 4-hydroxy-3-methylbut-2-enyl diphosphate reductase [Hyphomicrobiales bacterium]